MSLYKCQDEVTLTLAPWPIQQSIETIPVEPPCSRSQLLSAQMSNLWATVADSCVFADSTSLVEMALKILPVQHWQVDRGFPFLVSILLKLFSILTDIEAK